MKTFLYKFLFFLLPIIGLAYFLDIFLSKNLKKSNNHAQKEYTTWNAVLEGKLKSDIYVYGSSRSWVHFNSKIIQESLGMTTYNLGIDGNGFDLQYFRHKLALQYNPKPKLIIHSVDIGTFEHISMFNPDQFLPYLLWQKEFYKGISKYKVYNFYDCNIPLIRYTGRFDAIKTALKMCFMPQDNPQGRVRGFQGQDIAWNSDFMKAKKAMKSYSAEFNLKIYEQFKRYLEECKTNNIKVVLVFSPVYIKGQRFMKNLDFILSVYEKLADKYGILFLDFSKNEICHRKEYFYNTTHLNTKGAEMFTKELVIRLKDSKLMKFINTNKAKT